MRQSVASIQFLRFVAATLVVLFHSVEAANKYFSGIIPTSFLYNAGLGASGVHIFFVISGFIMVYTSFHNNNGQIFISSNFIIRRLIRIYPIYFVYSIFYLYFYHMLSSGKDLSFDQLIGSLLLFPGYSSLIIGPGWTLSYELYFYLCFSIAMMLGLARGVLALTMFFAAAIALRLAIDTSHPAIHVFTNSLLIEFLLGVWIGYAVVAGARVGYKASNAMLVVGFAGFLAGNIFGYARLPSLVTWGIPSALLVAGLVFREANGRVPFFIKKYSFLGDSSYSLYLLHIVLIDAVFLLTIFSVDSIRTYAFQIGPFGMIAICFVVAAYCVAVAFIFYELIERRVVGRLQDLHRRRIAAPGKQQAQ